jgi:hypothetical protein
MWEKCVGCGEGLFAGDAFCGNCGRPVKPAVPAAREPGGLESGPLTAPAAGRPQVRIIPAHRGDPPENGAAEQVAADQVAADQVAANQVAPDQVAPDQLAPQPVAPGQAAADQITSGQAADAARQNGTAQQHGTSGHASPGRRIRGWHDTTGRHDTTGPRGGSAGRPHGAGTTGNEAAGPAGPARPVPAKLSGLANLDPARNPRYLMYVLRQACVFTGIYLLIETLLLLGLLLATAAGTKLGPALRVELDSLWLVALVLAIPFWLIPVPALLAEWSQVMEQSSEATQTASEYINSAFRSHGTPVDSLRVRTVSRHGEGDHEYLELRRGPFSGYISCFAHGHDLYVGWTFWLHMSPLRLLMMIIGRNIRDMTSRGDGIRRSLRFESVRALVAAMHGASLAGIDAASSQPGPAGPLAVKETAISMNVRMG